MQCAAPAPFLPPVNVFFFLIEEEKIVLFSDIFKILDYYRFLYISWLLRITEFLGITFQMIFFFFVRGAKNLPV